MENSNSVPVSGLPRLPASVIVRALRAGARPCRPVNSPVGHLPGRSAADPASIKAACLFNRGLALHADGDLSDAIEFYKAALKVARETEPDSVHTSGVDVADCYYNIGRCLDGLGQFADAAQAMRTSLAERPRDTNALLCLAAALRDAGESLPALEAYREYFAAAPQCLEADGYRTLGLEEEGIFGRRAVAESQATAAPSPQLHAQDLSEARRSLREMRTTLGNLGFSAAGVGARLGVAVGADSATDLHKLREEESVLAKLGDDALGITTKLFFFGLCLPRTQVSLSGLPLEAWLNLGMLIACAVDSCRVLSPIQLFPLSAGTPEGPLDLLIASDWGVPNLLPSAADLVMRVDSCTLALIMHAPRRPRLRNLLDLCCGNGVQGLVALASGAAEHVVATDVNPRCIHFTKVNAMLNGVEDRIKAFCSDLYSALQEGEMFDAIYANPPYVPAPFASGRLQTVKYADGGIDGAAILRRVVQGAGRRLRCGGFTLLVTELANIDSCSWLQAECGAGSCELHIFHNPGQRWTLAEYVEESCAEHPNGPGRAAWEAALKKAGIKDIGCVLLCAKWTDKTSAEKVAQGTCFQLHPLSGDGNDFLGVEENPQPLQQALCHALGLERATAEDAGGEDHAISTHAEDDDIKEPRLKRAR